MDPRERVVISLPLVELFDSRGPVAARRTSDLHPEQIRELLRAGPVQFVVVEPGTRPQWIPRDECFDFWKREVTENIAAGARIDPNALLRGYCYRASRWESESGAPIVVLEKLH